MKIFMLSALFQVAKYIYKFFSIVIHHLTIIDALIQITNIAIDNLCLKLIVSFLFQS